jgi:hypothetical protein
MSRQFPFYRPLAIAILCGLLATPALAQSVPKGTGLEDPGPPGMGMGGPPPGMGGPPPDGRFDPFAGLPRPLTPDAVRKALDEQFSKRPHVGQVTERDDKTLMVEIVNPDGRSMKMLVDKETGARQPLR